MTKLDRLDIALIFILLVSLGVYTYGIEWGLPSVNGWAADELIPLRVLEGIESGFSNGWHYKYPPFHFYVLTLFYSPLLLLDRLNVVDIYSLPDYTVLFYIGRFVSVIFAIGIVFFVYRCGREIYDKKASVLAAAIAAVNCSFFYYAKTINLEAAYLFWFTLSLLFYLRILKSQNFKDYVLFSIVAAIAVCTKDQAYGFYILTPLFLVWQHQGYLQKQNPAITLKQSLLHRNIIGALVCGLGAFIILHNLVFNWEGFVEHIELITSGGGSIRPRYEQNLWGQLRMFRQSLTHLRFSMGWPIYGVCLVGLATSVRQFRKNYLLFSLWVPIVSYYLFYVCLVWYNNIRYLMPIAIVLAWFGGKFLAEQLHPSGKLFKVKAIAVSLIFVYTLAYSWTINVLMVNDSRYEVEAWMKANIPAQSLVLGAGDAKYLPRLDGFNSEIIQDLSVDMLSAMQPDYIILTSGYDIRRFEKGSPKYEFFSRVTEGKEYELAFQYKSFPRWYLFDRREVEYRNLDKMYVYSNFDKINPEIKVLKKRE